MVQVKDRNSWKVLPWQPSCLQQDQSPLGSGWRGQINHLTCTNKWSSGGISYHIEGRINSESYLCNKPRVYILCELDDTHKLHVYTTYTKKVFFFKNYIFRRNVSMYMYIFMCMVDLCTPVHMYCVPLHGPLCTCMYMCLILKNLIGWMAFLNYMYTVS